MPWFLSLNGETHVKEVGRQEDVMLAPFLKLLLGVFLILLPFLLMVHKVRQLLLSFLPLTPWREKVIKILMSGLCWIMLEVIGLHLILDQLIPGPGTIYIHATEEAGDYSVAIENIAIEIAPVKYPGDVDYSRVYRGYFNKRGIYPAFVLFGD